MARVLIWDLPTRLFHWLFAGGFLGAAFIALVIGEDGPLFPYHAIIGLTIALMVALRLAWGVAGTRYARFGSFLFTPDKVIAYTVGVFTGKGKRHIGHNPGSAYAIFAMLAIMLALAVTGVMMGQGNESVEELHEFLAYAMLVVIGAHILGVVVHSIRHRENITASMIHGHKSAEADDAIRSSHPLAALALLVIAGLWAAGLLGNYDAATQTTSLPLIGTALQLGEAENEAEGYGGHDTHEDDDDD